MTKVTCDMAVSVDGFVAGPNQSEASPFGDGVGDSLHGWMFDEPEAHAAEIEAITAAGAYVMGRNMFGPGRGAWDLSWRAASASSTASPAPASSWSAPAPRRA